MALVLVVIVPTMPLAMALSPLAFPPPPLTPLLFTPFACLPIVVVTWRHYHRARSNVDRGRFVVHRGRRRCNYDTWNTDANSDVYPCLGGA